MIRWPGRDFDEAGDATTGALGDRSEGPVPSPARADARPRARLGAARRGDRLVVPGTALRGRLRGRPRPAAAGDPPDGGAVHGPGHRAAQEAVLYAFDVLYLDGRDLRRKTMEARRAALVSMLSMCAPGGAVRFSEHVEGLGEAMFRHACRIGLEGIVSKRRGRPYV